MLGGSWFPLLSLGGAVACYGPTGSPDAPGLGQDDFEPGSVERYSYELTSTTLTDARTGETLASRCGEPGGGPSIRAEIGRQLELEITWLSVRDASFPEKSCASHPGFEVNQATLVSNLECWTYEETSPVRVLEQAILPPEACRSSTMSTVVPGRGYRFRLEVLGYGVFTLVPSGSCDVPPQYVLGVLEPE